MQPHTALLVLKNRGEIRKRIDTMHKEFPFTINSKTLLTEKAGKFVNDVYTPTANSWLLNPLIAHSLMLPREANIYFEKLPTAKQLENVGHQVLDFKKITQAISDTVRDHQCTVYLSDIQRLEGHNFLYFSPELQTRIINCLESSHPELTASLYTFVHDKFTWEKEIEIVRQRLGSVAHHMGPSQTSEQEYETLDNINIIGEIIIQYHKLKPFVKRSETILTESTCNDDGVADNAWYMNPLIASALIQTDKLFAPLPSFSDL
jgi:hypothetical protein